MDWSQPCIQVRETEVHAYIAFRGETCLMMIDAYLMIIGYGDKQG